MDKKFAKHAHYSSRQTTPHDKSLVHHEQFRIKHYAGDVTYNIDGFLDKNRDTIFQDFKRVLYNSRDSCIREMWPEGSAQRTVVTKRPVTTATAFKTSMLALVRSATLTEMKRFSLKKRVEKMYFLKEPANCYLLLAGKMPRNDDYVYDEM